MVARDLGRYVHIGDDTTATCAASPSNAQEQIDSYHLLSPKS